MEVEKRKRFKGEEEVNGKKVKAKVEAEKTQGGETTAVAALKGSDHQRDDEGGDPDSEVEEFFAILRRIHVAVKYFENGKGRNGSEKKKKKSTASATAAMPWSPNFERQDFEGDNSNGVKGEETVGDNVGLDLNVVPDPDYD